MPTADEPFHGDGSSDFTITSSDGWEFHVHRLILSLGSNFFARKFEEEPGSATYLSTYEKDVLDPLLRFIYPATPTVRDLLHARSILRAADKFETPHVPAAVDDKITHMMMYDPLNSWAVACQLPRQTAAQNATEALAQRAAKIWKVVTGCKKLVDGSQTLGLVDRTNALVYRRLLVYEFSPSPEPPTFLAVDPPEPRRTLDETFPFDVAGGMRNAAFHTKLNERFDVHTGYIQQASQALYDTLQMFPQQENHVTMYHCDVPYSGRAMWLLLALCYEGVAEEPPTRKAIKTAFQEASPRDIHEFMTAVDAYHLRSKFEARWLVLASGKLFNGRAYLSVYLYAVSNNWPEAARKAAFGWVQSGDAGGPSDVPCGEIPEDILAGVRAPVLRILVKFRDECLKAKSGTRMETIADNVSACASDFRRFLTRTSYTGWAVRGSG